MSVSAERIPVPDVTVTVGPIVLRHWPAGGWSSAEDDSLPEAVGGACLLTFHFGERVRSKWLKAKVRFCTPLGWPRDEPVSPSAIEEAGASVVVSLIDQMRAHGFEPPADIEVKVGS